MKKLIGKPWTVYSVLLGLAGLGLWSAFQLPISLYPQSQRPEISIYVPLLEITRDNFLEQFGKSFEDKVRRYRSKKASIENLKAYYGENRIEYRLTYEWNTDFEDAVGETDRLGQELKNQLPKAMRDQFYVSYFNPNTGYFLSTFYSEKRSLDELYKLLRTNLIPKLQAFPDLGIAELYNPEQKEIRIELNPYALAQHQLLPKDIEGQLLARLKKVRLGRFSQDDRYYHLEFERSVTNFEDIFALQIATSGSKMVPLSHLAKVTFRKQSEETQIFRTQGVASLFLFVTPKPNGNLRTLSQEVKNEIQTQLKHLPSDIKVQSILDPSEFIDGAILNVFKEVGFASLLAVLTLFFFIGSFRNIFMAAVEIPLSLIISFILMKLFHININLISLGGLALASGMNVDASVVVIENILKKFENNPLVTSFEQKWQLIYEAVTEVRTAILSSTLCSIIVFAPLLFTSNFTHALLGDLAYAVIFSHGLSALIALILVPTLRLHLMKHSHGTFHNIFETQIKKLEVLYRQLLQFYFSNRFIHPAVCAILVLSLTTSLLFFIPKLRKELIGRPQTDWIVLSVSEPNHEKAYELEPLIFNTEKQALKVLGTNALYSFYQIYSGHSGDILIRISNKRRATQLIKLLEDSFPNNGTVNYRVSDWNPSEFHFPASFSSRIVAQGSSLESRHRFSRILKDTLSDKKIFGFLRTDPSIDQAHYLKFSPTSPNHDTLFSTQARFGLQDLSDYYQLASEGKRLTELHQGVQQYPVWMFIKSKDIQYKEDLGSIPVGIGGKVIPLRSVARWEAYESEGTLLREDGQERTVLDVVASHEEEKNLEERLQKTRQLLHQLQKEKPEFSNLSVQISTNSGEMEESFSQILRSFVISFSLICIVLLIQFRNIFKTGLVLMAIPTGVIGASVFSYLFNSPLSLNFGLGIILLNGITVANGILLVDFISTQHKAHPHDLVHATFEGAVSRLRPILITSLTTILGMAPIALGLGEGGKVLQPLGITVCFGLLVSLVFTLFLVPYFQYCLVRRQRRLK